MSTLLLKFAGPMQAWGDASRFTRRDTTSEPTKSGVLGLLAAAQGRRRTDPIEDLLSLRFGVRIDQPGRIERDFQTARRSTDGAVMPLSNRYYLCDAAFLVGIEGDEGVLESFVESLRRPTFPLYLGRRACPVPPDLIQGITAGGLLESLASHEWIASIWYQRRFAQSVHLPIVMDDDPELDGDRFTARDVPHCFDPERREYGWRQVLRIDGLAQVTNQATPEEAEDFFNVVASA